jgi:hypothetical protein
MTPFADIAPIIGKLVRMLASNSHGEVVACAAALRRVLASAKLDMNDLGN